jgi:hypothetical protein
MTDTMKLVHSTPTTTEFDFLNSAHYLVLDSWRSTPAGVGLVLETFVVAFVGTDAVIRADVESMMRMKHQVDLYWAGAGDERGVWLHLYGDGDNSKRALVAGMEAVPASEMTFTPLVGQGMLLYQIAITRLEAWEYGSITTLVTDTTISGTGGKIAVDYGSSYYGSLAGRINKMTLRTGPATPLYRVWVGIQRYYHRGSEKTGGISDYPDINSYFDATWEAEVGTAVLGSFVNDATASPAGTSSNCLEVTSVPATLGRAWWSRLSNHETSGRVKMYVGNWYILARIKVNSGTVGVQLRYGVGSSAAGAVETNNEMVYVSNTSWRLIELGSVTFPPYGGRGGLGVSGNEAMSIFIQQISGTTTSFRLDEVILVPADNFVKAVKANIATGQGTNFFVDPDGKSDCLLQDYSYRPEATFINWEWPYEGGFLVVAAERETEHVLADTLHVVPLEIYKRFKGHRV